MKDDANVAMNHLDTVVLSYTYNPLYIHIIFKRAISTYLFIEENVNTIFDYLGFLCYLN